MQRRAEAALRTVDIEHLRNKPTHFLSHGEKKRVAIAGALVMEPQVLIIDELTACVDPRHQQEMLCLFDKLNEGGTTIVLSTHDVDLAWQWADRLLVMHKGEIAREVEPNTIFCDEQLLQKTGLCKPLVFDVFEVFEDCTATSRIAY